MHLGCHRDVGESLAISEEIDVATSIERVSFEGMIFFLLASLKVCDLLLDRFELLLLVRRLMALVAEMKNFQKV